MLVNMDLIIVEITYRGGRFQELLEFAIVSCEPNLKKCL